MNIFISYSRTNKIVADYLTDQLRHRGANVFIDYQRLEAGSFVSQLGQEIDRAEAVVALLSQNAVDSRWVQSEINYAFSNHKKIIPVLLEKVNFTKLFMVSSLEMVDFTNWEFCLGEESCEPISKLARLLGLPDVPKPLPISKSNIDEVKVQKRPFRVELVAEFEIVGHPDPAPLAFTLDKRFLIGLSHDENLKKLEMWDLMTRQKVWEKTSFDTLQYAVMPSSGNLVVSELKIVKESLTPYISTIQTIAPSSRKLLHAISIQSTDGGGFWYRKIPCSSDSKKIALLWYRSVDIVRLDGHTVGLSGLRGKPNYIERKINLEGIKLGNPDNAVFLPNNKLILVFTSDDILELCTFSISSGKRVSSFRRSRGHRGGMLPDLQVSIDGRLLLVDELYKLDRDGRVIDVIPKYDAETHSKIIAFTSQRQWLVRQGFREIYLGKLGENAIKIDLPIDIYDLTFSNDEQLLAGCALVTGTVDRYKIVIYRLEYPS